MQCSRERASSLNSLNSEYMERNPLPTTDLVISGCVEDPLNISSYLRLVQPRHTFVYAANCGVPCDAIEKGVRRVAWDAMTCIDRPNRGKEFAGFIDFALAVRLRRMRPHPAQRIVFASSTIHHYNRGPGVASVALDPLPSCMRIPLDRARTIQEEYWRPSSATYRRKELGASGRYPSLGTYLTGTLTGGWDRRAPNCRRAVFSTTLAALHRRTAREYTALLAEVSAFSNPVAGHWLESAALAVFALNETLSPCYHVNFQDCRDESRWDPPGVIPGQWAASGNSYIQGPGLQQGALG